MPGQLWTIEEAACFLAVSKSFLYKQVAAGLVPCVRLGRAVRFHPEALSGWVRAQLERGGEAD